MPTNVELKARARDFAKQKVTASEIADSGPALILQHDTFFHVPHGRLKLREFEDGSGQLIHYHRPDEATARASLYTIVDMAKAADLKTTLSEALGVRGEIHKRRWLFLAGQTRIHMDDVEGLGNFIELEVVMKEGQPVEEGQRIANDFKSKLGISEDDLLEAAYIDLLDRS